MNLGKTHINISKQGLGCMSMSEFYGQPMSEHEARELIKLAYKKGINFFDTADVYAYGENEELIGKAVNALIHHGVKREHLVIATKCGILRDKSDPTKRGVDNSYHYIKSACEKSLKRLGKSTGHIDLYYLHRIEKDIPDIKLKEAMRAMAELLAEGKIKAVGLSEASAEIIKKSNHFLMELTHSKHQLAAVQSEYSLLTRAVEFNGVLDTCRSLGITFVAYSPLSRALLTGKLDTTKLADNDFRKSLPRFQQENLEHNHKLVNLVAELAKEKRCSTAQIALAWVMAQKGVIPIPGTTKQTNLLSNIEAQNVNLTANDLKHLGDLGEAKGYRYSEAAMQSYGFEDEM